MIQINSRDPNQDLTGIERNQEGDGLEDQNPKTQDLNLERETTYLFPETETTDLIPEREKIDLDQKQTVKMDL